MPTPPTDTPGAPPPAIRRPEARQPAGVSRFGLVTGAFAAAGTFLVAALGLGGPPAPAATVALADAPATEPAAQRVVVKTVYVQLPSPTAAPVAAPASPAAHPRKAAAQVVTRQSGSGGGDGEGEAHEAEHEGDD